MNRGLVNIPCKEIILLVCPCGRLECFSKDLFEAGSNREGSMLKISQRYREKLSHMMSLMACEMEFGV